MKQLLNLCRIIFRQEQGPKLQPIRNAREYKQAVDQLVRDMKRVGL